jgi:Xaa-Pro aminopeptidase
MRVANLRNTLREKDLDAILISRAENRRYLSGFTGSAGILVITDQRAVLATDFRYWEQAGQEAPDFGLGKIQDKVSQFLPDLLADAGVKRLGFEAEDVSVDLLHEWSQATEGVAWIPLKGTVEAQRMVKEEKEIEALRRSTALTDAAFAHLLSVIKPRMTEREAAWEIESYMRTHGASRVAFDLIVAAGPSGAMPHAKPTDQAIEPGEPIVIDIGCVVDGYCSDMTRTFCLGKPSAKYLEVWDIVRQAQEAAENGIRAGMRGVDAHALAGELIEAAGHGEHFGHGLGHGVGLVIHENPRASRRSEDTLEAGMALTIEPGIYLPGEFGVRIEDLAIIREDGLEILTNTPKVPVIA